jgi:hypothetical protein
MSSVASSARRLPIPAYSIAHGNGVADPAIGPNDLENHFDARPPGTAIVISAFFRLLGTGQISARLGSILAGLTIIFFTYRLARDVIGEEGALTATFLIATDNLIVLTSRSARPEALTTMAILASLLAMKQYARSDRIVWAFLSGLRRVKAGQLMALSLLRNLLWPRLCWLARQVTRNCQRRNRLTPLGAFCLWRPGKGIQRSNRKAEICPFRAHFDRKCECQPHLLRNCETGTCAEAPDFYDLHGKHLALRATFSVFREVGSRTLPRIVPRVHRDTPRSTVPVSPWRACKFERAVEQ